MEDIVKSVWRNATRPWQPAGACSERVLKKQRGNKEKVFFHVSIFINKQKACKGAICKRVCVWNIKYSIVIQV